MKKIHSPRLGKDILVVLQDRLKVIALEYDDEISEFKVFSLHNLEHQREL